MGLTNRLLARRRQTGVPGLSDRRSPVAALPGHRSSDSARWLPTEPPPGRALASAQTRHACWSSAARRERRSINHAAVEAFAGASFSVLHAAGERDLPQLGARDQGMTCAASSPTSARRCSPATWWWRGREGRCSRSRHTACPAVLIPYPHASADHQSANARFMERAGAAVVISDDELTAHAAGAGGRIAAGGSSASGRDGRGGCARWPGRTRPATSRASCSPPQLRR